jgi:biopolymer transport protein TolQ
MWQEVVNLVPGGSEASAAAAAGLAVAPGSAPVAAAAAAPAAPAGGIELSPWQLILDAGPVVKSVLFLLLVASMLCWAIIVAKAILLVVARMKSRAFLREVDRSDDDETLEASARALSASPHARIFLAARREAEVRPGTGAAAPEGSPDEGPVKRMERTLARAVDGEITRMEGWLGWLATIGSTAPFIGLFGTVWGIMGSFLNIGAQQSATLAVVAPGIAEALIATAVGLVAAIPSVMAYNLFIRRIRVWNEDLSTFAGQLVNAEDARRDAAREGLAAGGPA